MWKSKLNKELAAKSICHLFSAEKLHKEGTKIISAPFRHSILCLLYTSDGGDGHGYYLANNFKDLLNNWSKVGCVGGEDWQWEVFYTEGKGIDSECENAKLWREYIFSKI